MSRMLLLAFVLLTLCLGLSKPGAAAPAISGITVNPNPIPAAGGQVTVTATVTDSVGLSSVVLQEGRTGYNFPYRTAPMSAGPDGVTYTASIPVDFNTSNGSNGETLNILATDPAGSKTASVATQTYSNTPPSITAVTASPLPIPAAGTRVTVKAKVTDPALGLSSVVLREGRPGYNFPYRTAPMAVGADGVTYTATIPVDINGNTGSNGETLDILATDPAGNQSTNSVGTQGFSSVPPFGSLPVLISADPAAPVLSPAFISAGGADLPLVINGINFAGGAVVLFNGFQLPLASYTSRQVTVNIPSSLIALPGSYAVTVVDPSPSGASNSVSLVVK